MSLFIFSAHDFLNPELIQIQEHLPPIEKIIRLSPKALKIKFTNPEDSKSKLNTTQLSERFEMDFNFSPTHLAPIKLAVFDMDSTLIQAEVIDEMALLHGVGEEVALITKKAMNGELDFNQSLLARVHLLKGLNRLKLETLNQKLPLMPGVQSFISFLHSKKVTTAVVSGGFSFFAHQLKEKLHLHHAFAHELEFLNDQLTGNILGPIINGETKKQIVMKLQNDQQLSMSQVMCVGDGANDIPMIKIAGVGAAVHGKPILKKESSFIIDYTDMSFLKFLWDEQ